MVPIRDNFKAFFLSDNNGEMIALENPFLSFILPQMIRPFLSGFVFRLVEKN